MVEIKSWESQNGSIVGELLQGNLKFREDVYNASIERNQELAAGQNPGVLWIGCSDSRSDPERITGAGPGELFVTRNVGNIVPNHDWSLATVLEYSINYLNAQRSLSAGIPTVVLSSHSIQIFTTPISRSGSMMPVRQRRV